MKSNIIVQLTTLLFFSLVLNAQPVIFRVDMNAINNPEQVGIRGSVVPLSWEKTYPLTDHDGDGIFEGKIEFDQSDIDKVEFKFVYGNVEWELATGDNRSISLKNLPKQMKIYQFDVPITLSGGEVDKMVIRAEDLQKDVAILQKAYTSLHPGLYRYNSPEEMNAHFASLKEELNEDKTLAEVFLAFARFIPKIRCGHTLVNPYNQSNLIKRAFFYTSDKVPFTFNWAGKRMVITHNLSDSGQLEPGVEIVSINGVLVSEIIETLLPYISADGYQMNKRMWALQLQGIEEYEDFDIIFPLLFPPTNGVYSIKALNHKTDQTIEVEVSAMSRANRKKQLTEKYGINTDSYDGSWQFHILSDQLAHLKLGTFVTYKMEMNWKAFLKDAFQQLKEKQIPNLIIDIRGNGGGMDDVSMELAKYLLKEDIQVEEMLSLARYQTIPKELEPYLSTWDNKFKNISSWVEPYKDGFYKMKADSERYQVIKKSNSKLIFSGRTFLLTDASNSSATFYLARMAKQGKIATLVGQTTGGTQKGLNGGAMFFLRLPHSGVEMDIPLFGNFPYQEAPDLGIVPDVVVEKRLEDFMEGRDTEIEAVKSIISGNQ